MGRMSRLYSNRPWAAAVERVANSKNNEGSRRGMTGHFFLEGIQQGIQHRERPADGDPAEPASDEHRQPGSEHHGERKWQVPAIAADGRRIGPDPGKCPDGKEELPGTAEDQVERDAELEQQKSAAKSAGPAAIAAILKRKKQQAEDDN